MVAWLMSNVCLLVILAPLYFLPTIIMVMRADDHPSGCGLMVLNTLLGWTLVGWVLAFIWSFSSVPRPAVQTAATQCLACGSFNVATLPDGVRICGSCGQRG